MNEPEFLGWETVEDLHQESLARHGGLDGIRDRGALESALAAAENTYFYGGGDLYEIGASYAFHLAESQGFSTATSGQRLRVLRPFSRQTIASIAQTIWFSTTR